MSKSLSLHWLGIAPLLLAVGAGAETLPVPDGFGLKPAGRQERVVYMERRSEHPNGTDRRALEQICSARQALEASAPQPVFEAGHDEPVRTQSRHFFSADGLRRAVYTETTAYQCDAELLKTRGPCGCTYRNQVTHQVEISLWRDGRVQRWKAGLEEGRGMLEEGASPAPGSLPAPDEAVLTRLYGPVTGEARMAGWACAQRELPGPVPRQTCLALPDPKLPKWLWGRALSGVALTGPQAGGMRQRSELQRLLPAADVDAAVFTPPPGIEFRRRQRTAIPAQELQP